MTTPAHRAAPTGMTKAEVAKLLTLIASFDQRTIAHADVEAWHLVAPAAGWTLPWASRAVVEFFTDATDERIRPGHITRTIRHRRARYANTLRLPETPAHLAADPTGQVAWEHQQLAAHLDTCMDRWARGEDPTR